MDFLESNEWSRFKPRVIVIDILCKTFSTVSSTIEYLFLTNNDYVPVPTIYHSVIFVCYEKLIADNWS